MDLEGFERILKENVHINLGAFFDEDEKKFAVTAFVEGAGLIEAYGETLSEAIENFNQQWKIK